MHYLLSVDHNGMAAHLTINTVFTRIYCAIESNVHPSFGPLNFKKHFARECNAHENCGNLNKCT